MRRSEMMTQDSSKDSSNKAGSPGPECCGPSTSGEECCAPPAASSKRGRLAVFLVVTIAAMAVLAYGLLFKGGSSATEGTAEASAQTDGSAASLASTPGCAMSSGGALTAVSVSEGTDVLFVLLAGEDQERTRAVAQVLDASVEKIRKQGKTASVRTIHKNENGFEELSKQCSLSTFPSVAAVGKGSGWTTVTGEITEAQVLQAFVVANQQPSGCSAGAACCPAGTK
jgi:hypothetical protein